LFGPRRALLLAAAAAVAAGACRTAKQEPEPPRPPEPGPVRKVDEEIVVAAWAEPRQLPLGGGEAQILVRAQKRGGAPFAGVEVRLSASEGKLFSQGRLLITDKGGMTRDRLSTQRSALVTVNAGGTRYTFTVRVRERPPSRSQPDEAHSRRPAFTSATSEPRHGTSREDGPVARGR
jgi:hypothetical protein